MIEVRFEIPEPYRSYYISVDTSVKETANQGGNKQGSAEPKAAPASRSPPGFWASDSETRRGQQKVHDQYQRQSYY